MGYLDSHFPQIIRDYSNLIDFEASNKPRPMTMNNLMLYLQQTCLEKTHSLKASYRVVITLKENEPFIRLYDYLTNF